MPDDDTLDARHVRGAQRPRPDLMSGDPNDPATWPADTVVLRCGSAQGIRELTERLSRDGSWSVFSGPGVPLFELARSCRNNQVRRTTVGAILRAGGRLRPSPGPPHHHDLSGLTPQEFDAILGVPEPNPMPRPDRWKPS